MAAIKTVLIDFFRWPLGIGPISTNSAWDPGILTCLRLSMIQTSYLEETLVESSPPSHVYLGPRPATELCFITPRVKYVWNPATAAT